MIRKYRIGNPIETDSIVVNIALEEKSIPYFDVSKEKKEMLHELDAKDRIYGLGETVRGINKRGYIYISDCSDDPVHTEDKCSLYAAQNFIVLWGNKKGFGMYVDTPGKVTFDIGYTDKDVLRIGFEDFDADIYIIEGDSILDIVRQFREIIGKSYVPPRWAFGFGQSRWSYMDEGQVRDVVKAYDEQDIPIDSVYLDIDYMERYKDFTVSQERFPEFSSFVKEMSDQDIHLVPIIDAGVKIEDGYDVYEEGIKGDYFCKKENGENLVAAVWPGKVHFPDFLNEDARRWFGDKYKVLLDYGIDGFWNDMNEPALFYGKEKLEELAQYLKGIDYDNFTVKEYNDVKYHSLRLKNYIEDYKGMYHKYDLAYSNDNIINHYDVHNMYGYKMVEAASNYFNEYNEENNTNKKYLLFSRSSMIGSHRYSGIWTGDNAASWDHLLMNIKMMPSLNMCGYLYSGADIGGFGHNASEDLLLRWMAFGIFTPLFRNHTCNSVRPKDYHLMSKTNIIRNLLSIRYAILPYLYSEYIKAVENNTLLFTQLSFVFKDDPRTYEIEDELIFGKSIIIAPVYKQNTKGRMVYLPTSTLVVRMKNGKKYTTKKLSKGDHYIKVDIDEVVFFVMDHELVPLLKINDLDSIKNINSLDLNNYEIINNGYKYNKYELFYEENNTVKSKILDVNK